jgi:hypothetical protein
MPEIQFTATLEKFDSNLWGHHLPVPDAVAQQFIAEGIKRVVATLNEAESYQCALMPMGQGSYFLNVNKKLRDKLGLKVGMPVRIRLVPDESEYGLPMPEELAELFKLDDEGDRLFHALTPGKQRTLLYIIGSAKSSDARIGRALAVVDHLKAHAGKINFKAL